MKMSRGADTHGRRLLMAGRLMTAAALAGTMVFYWRSLQDESVPSRSPILVAQMRSTPGFGAAWTVPEGMVSKRWARIPVRVWEAGKPLPLRLEAESAVTNQGSGRFCVQGNTVWFSATEQSNPASNGRPYEFEAGRPNHRAAFMAGGLLALAAVLGLACLPWRGWLDRAARTFSIQALTPARICTLAGMFLLGVAALFWLLTMSAISRDVHIPPGAIFQKPEGQFSFSLPRWISGHRFRWETAQLFEDQKPLAPGTIESLKLETSSGSYFSDRDSLWLRASDGSLPPVNGRDYRLKVSLFWPRPFIWWNLFFAGLALLLVGRMDLWKKQPALAPRPLKVWWMSVVVVGLKNCGIVAGDDSMAQGADGWVYADAALDPIWGGSYSWLPPLPPGFPFIAGIVAQFGVPWRMALELLFLGACSYLALGVVSLTRSRLVGFVLFSLMAWHPWPLSGFRDFMSDPFVLVLVVALLGLMFRLLSRPAPEWKGRDLLLMAGGLFLWEWARRENPLVYASYGLFAALALVAARMRPDWTLRAIPALAGRLALPAVLALCLAATVNWVNYQRTGVYAKCQLEAPGFTALMKALYRVKSDQAVRYGPVTRQSLHAACEASPTLKPFEPALLSPNSGSALVGQSYMDTPGEFGPTLNTLLLESIPGGPAKANSLMNQAAQEIELALQAGRLPRRRILYPLDPNWHLWLPKVAGHVGHRMSEGASMRPAGEPWGTYHRPRLQHVFDQAAGRRAANIYPRMLLAEGHVVATPGAIDSMAVSDEQGRWLGASRVSGALSPWEQGQPFDIRSFVESEPAGYRLIFFRQGKPQYEVDLKPEPAATWTSGNCRYSRAVERSESKVALAEGGESFSYHFKACFVQSALKTRRETWEKTIGLYYPRVLLCALVLVCARTILGSRWERDQLRSGTLCLLLAAGWFAGRAILFGILDANFGGYFSEAPRFMRCLSPVFIPILILAAWVAAGFLRLRFRAADAGTAAETKPGIPIPPHA